MLMKFAKVEKSNNSKKHKQLSEVVYYLCNNYKSLKIFLMRLTRKKTMQFKEISLFKLLEIILM